MKGTINSALARAVRRYRRTVPIQMNDNRVERRNERSENTVKPVPIQSGTETTLIRTKEVWIDLETTFTAGEENRGGLVEVWIGAFAVSGGVISV